MRVKPSMAVSAQVGFGVAVDEALELGVDWVWGRVTALASLLRASLAGAPRARP